VSSRLLTEFETSSLMSRQRLPTRVRRESSETWSEKDSSIGSHHPKHGRIREARLSDEGGAVLGRAQRRVDIIYAEMLEGICLA